MTATGEAIGLNTLAVGTAGPRIAFLHGLFGQGRNWNQIAKAVTGPVGDEARCLLVDLPDHGRSPWSTEFSLEGYADAVAQTLRGAGDGEPFTVVGHSLGGKVAMVLALRHPALVERLVVVDIAPKGYGSLERFEGYIREMQALPLGETASRADAEARFEEPDAGVKAFLLQNLRRDGAGWRWQVNLDLVARDAALGAGSRIADWSIAVDDLAPYPGPVLWVAGGESRYVTRDDAARMRGYFPRTRLFTIRARATGCTPTPPASSSRPCAVSSAPDPAAAGSNAGLMTERLGTPGRSTPNESFAGEGQRRGRRGRRRGGGGGGRQRRRRPMAQAVSSWRELSCSLRSTELTWVSTVLTEMNSSSRPPCTGSRGR